MGGEAGGIEWIFSPHITWGKKLLLLPVSGTTLWLSPSSQHNKDLDRCTEVQENIGQRKSEFKSTGPSCCNKGCNLLLACCNNYYHWTIWQCNHWHCTEDCTPWVKKPDYELFFSRLAVCHARAREILLVGPERVEARCILSLPRVINVPCWESFTGPGAANGLPLWEEGEGSSLSALQFSNILIFYMRGKGTVHPSSHLLAKRVSCPLDWTVDSMMCWLVVVYFHYVVYLCNICVFIKASQEELAPLLEDTIFGEAFLPLIWLLTRKLFNRFYLRNWSLMLAV